MATYVLDPLADARWADLLNGHPSASVFHTPNWIAALRKTYNYEPLVLTTCPPGEKLTNGIVFCRVPNLLTGSHLVSLPFSDYCEPLASSEGELENLLNSVGGLTSRLGYVELRPLRVSPPARTGFGPSAAFFTHILPLSGSQAEIFAGFSRDSVQRKIHRAEREGLGYEEGRSKRLIDLFYSLLVLNRRRQFIPPQPRAWFQALATSLGENMCVRVAYRGRRAIASIMTLQFGKSMVYKYGCSDAAYHSLGGIQMLLWRSIQEAIASGLRQLELGRCDIDNEGLATFKERWRANRSLLLYWSSPPAQTGSRKFWNHALPPRFVKYIPDQLLMLSGRLLYKYIG